MKGFLTGVAILIFLFGGGGIARAEGSDLQRGRTLAADADQPLFGLAFRGAVRAKLGSLLPLVGSESASGFLLSLSPMVELHEPSGSDQVLPSQYWRARVSLDPSYAWQGEAASYRLGVGIEHESDHETAHSYSQTGFFTLNAAVVRGQTQWKLGGLRVSLLPALRLYAISCTSDREQCEEFAGDVSFGAQIDFVLDVPETSLAGLYPFVALSGFAIINHDQVQGERHVELHFGLWRRVEALLMQLFLSAYAGNDVGVTRAKRFMQVGAGISLAFLP